MRKFQARLDILPAAQRTLWRELDATPDHFTLYGGTALALRLGHRQPVDFDFFSHLAFDPEALAGEIPYLAGAERVQVAGHILTCRVERGGPVAAPDLIRGAKKATGGPPRGCRGAAIPAGCRRGAR